MSSNTSQRRAQKLLLAARVAEYTSWTIIVSCAACTPARTLSMATLPAELTVMQAIMRMRCRSCHGRVVAAALDNGVRGWRGRVGRLWGAGAHG